MKVLKNFLCHHDLARRDVLRSALVAGVGLGATALTTALWPAAAAAATGKRGGHATVLNFAYPEVWDPHVAGTLGALAAISPMYNQVVEFNPVKPGEIIGDLATSWEVTDGGLTYTFHLHEHVQWWDGKALTAEDVAFSINRMIEPGKPRPRVGLLRPMTHSAEVVDRHTVRVRLHYPATSFLQFLAVDYMKVVPKHVVEAGVNINAWENIVGSGPFKIQTARRGDAVMYERNPTYFKQGLPYLDKLTLVAITDKGTAAAFIKAGKITMTTAVSGLEVDDLLKLEQELPGKYTCYWQPVNNMESFFPNVQRAPWQDLRVVKALRLATDQQEIQQAFGAGKYALGAPFPMGSWYGSSPDDLHRRPGYRQPKEPDIVEAKKLLKEAGYDPPARLGKRVLTVPIGLYWPDLAQLWVAQMRRHLGLDIDIKLVDTPSAVTSYSSGEFDLGLWFYGYNIADPDDFLNALYGPGARNYTRWRNDTFLALFNQQSREADRDKRLHILRQIEEFLFTVEDPYIQVMWASRAYIMSDKLRTAAGPFVPAETVHTVLKWEHVWLEA